jgi:hypothetical protein
VPRKPGDYRKKVELSGLFNEAMGPLGNLLIHSRAGGWLHAISSRVPHRVAHGMSDPAKCPCNSFKLLDLYWQQNAAALRPVWNAAVKRRFLSGYQLFMDENLRSCHANGCFVSVPSASGGFNFDCVMLGSAEIPPAGAWIGKAPGPWQHTCPVDCTGMAPVIYLNFAAFDTNGYRGEPVGIHFNAYKVGMPKHADPSCDWELSGYAIDASSSPTGYQYKSALGASLACNDGVWSLSMGFWKVLGAHEWGGVDYLLPAPLGAPLGAWSTSNGVPAPALTTTSS